VVESRISGQPGDTRRYTFSPAPGAPALTRHLMLARPRGEMAGFGNLPPMPVRFETRRIGATSYIRLNLFLDLVRVIGEFGDTVSSCTPHLTGCDGLVIDLRGNPGGIGAMAMGMAGWLVDSKDGIADQRLGTMQMRDASLKFFINPRTPLFSGPVAVLIDGSSASTSEILAGGLQDLHRARVFGTKSAAAALPSVITRLPNGDGFQYAVANYISEGGRALEGNGVTPDQEVKLTRAALLEGRDPVIEAALNWIRTQKAKK